ncbi:15342_t:CDS:2 [Racocetra persica]|uniref:15342_t:CDS:1 n=1 Tax=Racocetra persica TaxID=160502 RepID=A0ACA9MLT1_9GLOM|nr:15342_t:CDS:2 [Racocetra persica]
MLIKTEANSTLASYYRDHKDEYMCFNCYNMIVVNRTDVFKKHAIEWERRLKRSREDNNFSIFESISILTNIIFERENQSMAISLWNLKDELVENNNNLMWVDSVNVLAQFLYDREKNKQEPVIYSFKQLRREIVAKDFRLSSFFDSIYNTSLLENKSTKHLDKLNKKLVVEYYIICGNQNSKLTAFKKDISLFIDLMGVSTEAIDALSHTNITISRNVDTIAIPQIAQNSILVYNPKLIDSELICTFLDYYYMERMSRTFNDQFYYEVPSNEKLENMTLHRYDDRIQEWREKHKMKDIILLDFFELSLKEIDLYINAL